MNISFEYRLRLASIIIIGASLFFMGCTAEQKFNPKEINIEISLSDSKSSLFVTDLSGLNIDKNDLRKVFQVFVLEEENAWSENDTPISGDYSLNDGKLTFNPKYPFLDATQYYARFDLTSMIGLEESDLVTEHTFTLSRDETPIVFVKEVYPTTDEIPRNLLKFYVQFSGSMSKGGMLNNVRILDDNNKVVEHAFLEIPQELWDANQQRLTILFDPGRIKRGMKLLDEVGAPFEIGKDYTLQINQSWKDAQQRSLTKEYVKQFTVLEDDRTKLNKSDWEISNPIKSTTHPLVINFNESLDYALLNRAISVYDENGTLIKGGISLSKFESLWMFTPDNVWETGTYTIIVETILEDLAGNNLISLFDVDLNNKDEIVNWDKAPTSITLDFKVN